jgi:hypothetical protein
MIGKSFTDEGANAILIVVLSGAVATLAARGAGRAFPGRVLSGVLSNPVRRSVPGGPGEWFRPPAAERGRAA